MAVASPMVKTPPVDWELKSFNPVASQPLTMSDATKIVLGTVGAAGLLSLVLVVALAI